MRLTCTSLLKETRGWRDASDLCESERVTSGIPAISLSSSCNTPTQRVTLLVVHWHNRYGCNGRLNAYGTSTFRRRVAVFERGFTPLRTAHTFPNHHLVFRAGEPTVWTDTQRILAPSGIVPDAPRPGHVALTVKSQGLLLRSFVYISRNLKGLLHYTTWRAQL